MDETQKECCSRGTDTSRIVIGLVILVLGVLFTLDHLDIVDVGQFWQWWPLILVAIGLGKVMQPSSARGRGFGAVLMLVGLWWLLDNLGVVEYSVWDLWPVLLILLGASILFRATQWGTRRLEQPPPPPTPHEGGFEAGPEQKGEPLRGSSGPEFLRATAILGGVERRCASRDFRGGSATAIMGGCELDLRYATIGTSPVVLDTFALWGGVDVKVPRDWNVIIDGTPLLGAMEDHTTPSQAASGQTLIVKGVAIMGGVEIKN